MVALWRFDVVSGYSRHCCLSVTTQCSNLPVEYNMLAAMKGKGTKLKVIKGLGVLGIIAAAVARAEEGSLLALSLLSSSKMDSDSARAKDVGMRSAMQLCCSAFETKGVVFTGWKEQQRSQDKRKIQG